MSYKKFNDLQNLYEGVVCESNEIDEYTELVYNVIIAEMVYRGHSESVIKTYCENISEEQIIEKLESFFSLEEYNLNEEQTDLLFSLYQEQQQLINEGWKQKTGEYGWKILQRLKGSSSKLKNQIASALKGFGKGKGTKQLELNLKGAKDGPGLLQRLKNLKTSTGEKLKNWRKGFDKKVTKTSDTLLGPDGKPLKTTKTVNPINKKNAAIVGTGIVGGAVLSSGGDKKKDNSSNNVTDKDKDDINKENQLQDVLNNKDKLQKLETSSKPKVVPGSEKIIKAKWANPSGKQLPKARTIGFDKGQVNPNSARGQMIARNKEMFGGKEIEKLRNKNAAFQAAKKSGSNYSMKDFVKDFPDSNAAKDARKSKRVTSVMDMESYDAKGEVLDELSAPLRMKKTKMDPPVKTKVKRGIETGVEAAKQTVKSGVKSAAQTVGATAKKIKNTAVKVAKEVKKGYDAQEEFDAYDLVLNYIMETEQASTIEEANYIMIEMDQNTIHEIVEEQKKTLIEWKGKVAAGAVLAMPWALSELEKRWNPVKKARDKYQDKKATEYENKSGTTKKDGYFR